MRAGERTIESGWAPALRPPLRGATHAWSWDYGYGWWYDYVPGYYRNEGALLAFYFANDLNRHHRYLDSRPFITRFCTASAISYYSGYDLVELAEAYILRPLLAIRAVVDGLCIAKIKGLRVAEIAPENVLVSRAGTALVGRLRISVLGAGTLYTWFDGTNVVFCQLVLPNGSVRQFFTTL